MEGIVKADIRIGKAVGSNASEGVGKKDVGNKEGVFGSDTNGCVSDMFPELSSTNLNKKNIDSSCVIDSLPDIPIPVNQNPVLNPSLSKSKVSNGNLGGNSLVKDKDNGGSVNTVKVGDAVMRETSNATKPL